MPSDDALARAEMVIGPCLYDCGVGEARCSCGRESTRLATATLIDETEQRGREQALRTAYELARDRKNSEPIGSERRDAAQLVVHRVLVLLKRTLAESATAALDAAPERE